MAEPRVLLPPLDLTIPLPGSTTARDVLSSALGRIVRELRPVVRSHAHLLPPREAASLDHLVATLVRERAGPLVSVLRRPNVGALVRTLRRPPGEADRALLRELSALLAFELAALGELPFAVALPDPPRRLVSSALDATIHVAADVESVTLTSDAIAVARGGAVASVPFSALRDGEAAPGAGLTVERSFFPVAGRTRLALVDNNPVSLEEAHPEKSGNAVDLGGAPVDAWVDSLRAAFDLVATYLPDLRAEMDVYLSQIVPVGALEDRHLSASFREAIGTVYLSLHPHPMTMVEALIHEFQHNKLNALFETDDVLNNAFSPLFRSPVRPDPRPLHGVLLAVHAFLPVARLYERMIAGKHPLVDHASFHARHGEIVAINREGAGVLLTNGMPTAIGRGVLGEIRRLHLEAGGA